MMMIILTRIAQGVHSQSDCAEARDLRDGDHSSSSPHGVGDRPHPVHHHQLVRFFSRDY